MLILDIHIFFILQFGIQKTLCHTTQEINRKVNALRVPAGSLDVSRVLCTAGQDHPIVILQELRRLYIFSDIRSSDKSHTFLFHDLYLAINDLFLQLHIRNAIHEQSADTVCSLVDGH